MAGPITASSSPGRVPNAARRCATADSSTPAATPRHPACTAARGACVSTVRLAAPGGLGYPAPRGTPRGGGPESPRSAGRSRAARAPRLPGADRLATPASRTGRRRSRLDALEPNLRVAEQLVERLSLVLALVEDAADARVDEHLQAVNAGRVRDVDVGVADAGAVLRRLRDGVDLGVD